MNNLKIVEKGVTLEDFVSACAAGVEAHPIVTVLLSAAIGIVVQFVLERCDCGIAGKLAGIIAFFVGGCLVGGAIEHHVLGGFAGGFIEFGIWCLIEAVKCIVVMYS